MGIAIMSCAQAKQEREQHENDHSLFLGGQNEALP